MKIGITQYTAGAGGLKLLERAEIIGLTGVEPMIAAADSDYLLWTNGEIEHFLRKANELGILVPTAATAVFNNDDSLITVEGQKKAIKMVRRSLEFTAAVGANAMLLCTYFASNPDSPSKKANLIKVLQELTPIACDLQIAIGLESPLPAEELANLVDEVGSEFVGVYYDVGNALYFGYDPAGEIERLGRRILSVHIKDTVKDLGDSHLGDGRLNLNSTMKSLEKVHYDGWLIIETPPGNDKAIQNDVKLLSRCMANAFNSVRM
jgi:L-ribulose-5-phosphate 3-epimerase